MRLLHDRRTGLYHDPRLPRLTGRKVHRGGVTTLWPYANAWAATRALATLDPGAPAGETTGAGGETSWRPVLDGHVAPLAAYGAPGTSLDPDDPEPLRLEAGTFHPLGARGDAYYDDCAWIALDLVAQHDLEHGSGDTGSPASSVELRLASRVLDFVLSGWSDDASIAHPGGIRWAEPSWSATRNTCANAPAAEAALLLHRRTGRPGALEWAERIVAWVDATLRNDAGLYEDRIEPDGTVHRELWTYNQGTMIGAKVLLYEATGEERHLAQARDSATAAVSWLARWETLVAQPPEFVAVYLRNLLLLGRHGDVSPGVEQVARFAESAWEHERHPSGLFPAAKPGLNPTAGMAAIYALLAGATAAP
jgi:hypothetical protein